MVVTRKLTGASMLRIALAALVLSTAPAWAFYPLVCKFTDSKSEWLIEINRATSAAGLRRGGPGTALFDWRQTGPYDSWRWAETDGALLIIKNRRRLEWRDNGHAPPDRALCREATLRDQKHR